MASSTESESRWKPRHKLRLSFRGKIARRLLARHPQPTYSAATKRTSAQDLKVGIVGGGMAGLYAAILLDSLGIGYVIHEANEKRAGGRVYTHHFSPQSENSNKPGTVEYYDYLDLGAMRFPRIPIMDRLIGDEDWSLVKFLNQPERLKGESPIRLVPYILSTDNNPQYFNGVKLPSNTDLHGDPFHFGDKYHGGQGSAVPDEYAQQPCDDFLARAYGPFKQAMREDFDKGFKELMKQDNQTTRSYMKTSSHLDYPDTVIDWLELLDSGTGLFGQAFTESVLDSFTFDEVEDQKWYAIDGGSSRLTSSLLRNVKNPPRLGERVTKIGKTTDGSKLTLRIGDRKEKDESYDHVICTLPLSIMRSVDTLGLGLSYLKRTAFRTLNYDHSVKVGLHFRTRWWEDPLKMEGKNFVGGKTATDLPIRIAVFPSYGTEVKDPPGVMFVSYTWAQDASRIGNMNDQHRVEVCLDNLSEIFGSVVREEYDGKYVVCDWDEEPYAQGAFALFGPAQFAALFPSLVQPEADGRYHTAGEAASVHHAWIVGSLDSAYRCVWEILEREGLEEKKKELIDRWGVIEEVDYGKFCDVEVDERSLLQKIADHFPRRKKAGRIGQSFLHPKVI